MWHFAAYMKPSRRCKERKKCDIAHLSLRFLLIHPLSISCRLFLPLSCLLPFLPSFLSLDLTLSRFLAIALLHLSLYLSRSPATATTKLLSFLFPFPRSPRPYLVTHKRLACNSPPVCTYRNEPPCFCGVCVTAVYARVESRGSSKHARMHAARPRTSFVDPRCTYFVFLLLFSHTINISIHCIGDLRRRPSFSVTIPLGYS